MTKTILAMILPVLLLASCTRDRSDDGGATTKTPVEKRNLPCLVPGAVYEGQIRIKVEPQTAALLEPAALASAAAPALSGVGTMDAALNELGAFRLERVFRHAGKYEERHRKAGLHLWYTVVFDESIDIMTAANHLAEIDGITLIEGIPVVERIDGKQEPVVATAQQIAAMGANNSIEPAAVQIYNDPQLSQQWHYYNDGSKSGFLTGADANVLRAWEIESGKSEVIVAVVDGGIDYLPREHRICGSMRPRRTAQRESTTTITDMSMIYMDITSSRMKAR